MFLIVLDLRKLYTSNVLNPQGTAQNLQDKVQFDIQFYFARRASENIDKFMKSTFKLETDINTGIKYIRKDIDEQTKNHQMDTEFVNSTMTEMPNSPPCPVASFMTYMTKLHPKCDYLWQQPKKIEDQQIETDIWYKPCKIGPNPLSTFMSRLSADAKLSMNYTNHSIRSTATTMLGRAQFTPKQIMSVTGHRSVNSLSVYQKVSENERLMMGLAMNAYLQSDIQPQVQQRPDIPQAIAPKPTQVTASLGAPKDTNPEEKTQPKQMEIVQYEPEDPLLKDDFDQELNFDVESVLQQIEEESVSMTQLDTVSGHATNFQCQKIKKSPVVPLFNNCKIGTITNLHIHVHKN